VEKKKKKKKKDKFFITIISYRQILCAIMFESDSLTDIVCPFCYPLRVVLSQLLQNLQIDIDNNSQLSVRLGWGGGAKPDQCKRVTHIAFGDIFTSQMKYNRNMKIKTIIAELNYYLIYYNLNEL